MVKKAEAAQKEAAKKVRVSLCVAPQHLFAATCRRPCCRRCPCCPLTGEQPRLRLPLLPCCRRCATELQL